MNKKNEVKSQLTRLDHMCYSSKKSGKVSRNVVQAVKVIVAETRVFKLRGVLKLPLVDFLKAFDMYTRQLLPKLSQKKKKLTDRKVARIAKRCFTTSKHCTWIVTGCLKVF